MNTCKTCSKYNKCSSCKEGFYYTNNDLCEDKCGIIGCKSCI